MDETSCTLCINGLCSNRCDPDWIATTMPHGKLILAVGAFESHARIATLESELASVRGQLDIERGISRRYLDNLYDSRNTICEMQRKLDQYARDFENAQKCMDLTHSAWEEYRATERVAYFFLVLGFVGAVEALMQDFPL